ncbi:MAG: DUF4178 domain-containing protein [Bdellovibrionaceae bacterium]|nr:DUF4178 domain-containing protein [Pseudobdellovibrionaceae bacterium]
MVKAITCPSCGGPVTVKYSEQSLSCVCPACLAVLSTANESVSILVKSQSKKTKPIIELGKRYNFRGHDWEVIGFLVRSDKSGSYKWSEYLLFNPYVGYRFLVCMDGHWSYVTKTKSAPKVDTALNRATYLDKTYTLFHKGQVKNVFVLGEFYWRVKANEIVTAVDYINPPEMLSLEKDADEEIWSIGEYVHKRDVEKAFKLAGLMPLDIGVAPHQPSPHNQDKKLASYVTWLVALVFLVHFGFLVAVPKRNIFEATYRVPLSTSPTITTAPFEISDKAGYIETELFAEVNNGWLETTVEAVEENTGEEYEFDQGVEYYSGYDSDGSWSEGSRTSDRRIAKLPPGKYHLNITTAWSYPSPTTFSFRVSEGNLSWGNFFFAFFLLILYPLYYFMRAKNFEKNRWSTSDYSPYWSQNDG